MGQEKRDELVERLKQAVIDYEEDDVIKAANEVLENGLDAYDAIMNGLAAGMEVVGDLFDKNEYFVPEVLMSADALYGGLDILRPHIREDAVDARTKGEVVIGTVEGDVHDIGKNIVKMMFEIAGFTVHDLGRDVPLEQFVEEQLRTDSDIVALSAMMTTTMVGMKTVVERIKAKNPNVIIMLGGAPLSGEIADKWGADGYADNAQNALSEAIRMVSSLRQLEAEGKLSKG